jgi:hypothetical protein
MLAALGRQDYVAACLPLLPPAGGPGPYPPPGSYPPPGGYPPQGAGPAPGYPVVGAPAGAAPMGGMFVQQPVASPGKERCGCSIGWVLFGVSRCAWAGVVEGRKPVSLSLRGGGGGGVG